MTTIEALWVAFAVLAAGGVMLLLDYIDYGKETSRRMATSLWTAGLVVGVVALVLEVALC